VSVAETRGGDGVMRWSWFCEMPSRFSYCIFIYALHRMNETKSYLLPSYLYLAVPLRYARGYWFPALSVSIT
jgi:hypothetical protein